MINLMKSILPNHNRSIPRVFISKVNISSKASNATSLQSVQIASTSSSTALDTTPKTTGSFLGQSKIYDELSKSKLSALVVMTTGAGFLMVGGPISWTSLAAVSVGTSLAACSANTFNQVWEVENDKLMNRTFRRPLPSGRISKAHALAWGVGTGITSTVVLAAGCNPLTAALGAFNIGLYSLVYTPMKTRSELNTWVGSLVGAIPPVMGVAAATGTILSYDAALTAATLFLWQFPHFFALSWRLRKDYARGGFKMVPCADPTGHRTADLVMRYSMYLSTLPVLATFSGITGSMFAVEGAVVNGYLVYLAKKFQDNPSTANANKVFMCSLWYLPVILGCMVFHSHNWSQDNQYNTNHAMHDRFYSKMSEIRYQLKNICIHEKLWGKEKEKKSNTSVFCPVSVTDKALDIAVEKAMPKTFEPKEIHH